MNISKINHLINNAKTGEDTLWRGNGLHPAVQIYVWICLTFATQILSKYGLVLLLVVTIMLSLKFCKIRFFSLLRRTRWIMLSILLIYSYTSEGRSVWPLLGNLSPIFEGMQNGLLQLSRLVTVLASLSILLALLSQAQLIEGLFVLIRPLELAGISRKELSVRLSLTLSYAERLIQNNVINLQQDIANLRLEDAVEPSFIEMQLNPFFRLDWLVLGGVSLALIGLWL